MAKVTLEKLHKRYPRGPHVVRGIDLDVADGAFVTLVGPSGCGKSTTLNIIAGLEEPTSGTIRFDGAVVNDLSPRERDVAMVFQSYALYPHKTVFENIAFPLRIAGAAQGEIDRRVREAADRLSIGALLDRLPRELSGGQRQRVALGRALVRRPRVFLLDEPLSNLDAALRLQTRAEVKRLHADLGTTFIYVTHDQAEAMTLSDEVVVLHEGVVQQRASPREVYDRPANVFTARFLGSPPIHILRAEVESGRLRTAAGSLTVADGRGAGLPASGPVLVGARPEDTRVEPPGSARDGVLAGRIYVVEPTGPETYVIVDLEGGDRVTCRADAGFTARPGEPVSVTLDPARLHLFDARTETRLGV